MEHITHKNTNGYTCSLCLWQWKSKPKGSCPGVRRYAWGHAPDYLKTSGQLKALKLKPGAPARGYVQGGKGGYDLFDQLEAVPFTAEELASFREQNRRARRVVCKHCKREVNKKKYNDYWQACAACLPVVQAKFEEEQEREEEMEKAEFEAMCTKDRDAAISWARNVLNNKEYYLILDTETTGLDDKARIVQVAMIDMDGSTVIDELVNPKRPIPPEATLIHGITDDMVSDKREFWQIERTMLRLARNKHIIIYNKDFDLRMIKQSGLLICYLNNPAYYDCAMLQYAAFVGEWNDYHGNYRWQRLPSGDHSARGDCLATLDLLRKMAATNLSTEGDQ